MLAIITVRYTPMITVTKRVRIRTATYRTTRDRGWGAFFAGTASGTGEPGSRVNSAITCSLQGRMNSLLRPCVDPLDKQIIVWSRTQTTQRTVRSLQREQPPLQV